MTEIYNEKYANNYTPSDIEDAIGKELFKFVLSDTDLELMTALLLGKHPAAGNCGSRAACAGAPPPAW